MTIPVFISPARVGLAWCEVGFLKLLWAEKELDTSPVLGAVNAGHHGAVGGSRDQAQSQTELSGLCLLVCTKGFLSSQSDRCQEDGMREKPRKIKTQDPLVLLAVGI